MPRQDRTKFSLIMPIPKSKPAEDEISADEVKKEAKGVIDKILKDVGKTSATQQVAIGTASGWYETKSIVCGSSFRTSGACLD